MVTYYEALKSNYRSVATALTHIERAVNAALRNADEPASKALTNTQMLLVAVKAEARLQKLMHTPGWLDEPQQAYILSASSRIDRWQRLIEVGFRKRYGKTKRKVPLADQLDHDAAARYRTLLEILEQDLRGVIEIRNKLAHGQWSYGMTEEGTISPDLTRRLRTTNTLELRFQDSIAEDMANAVGDLLQPGRQFEESFNGHYRKIKSSHDHLANLDFQAHVKRLRESKRNVRVTKTVT